MAEEAAEVSPPPSKKSGGVLVNAVVSFVMALLAVIAGGFINAKLHPLPDLKMGKDGMITAVVPVTGRRPWRRRGGGRQDLGLLRHRSADGGEFRGRLGRCASCKSPWR